MKNICRKYGQNEEVKNMIQKGFQKLLDRGHIKRLEDLTKEQRDKIENSSDAYTIPWDVGFKESSQSTPATPTFDASSKKMLVLSGTNFGDNPTVKVKSYVRRKAYLIRMFVKQILPK